MTVHLHHLLGCRPTPLAHYLKALGVLRLVAEQADTSARGGWRGESFVLLTRLGEQELLDFFLEQYSPTPLVTPWNGGSGFYPKDNKDGIEPLTSSTAERFATYRAAITACHDVVAGREQRPGADEKQLMLQTCRRRWRGALAGWLDAAITLSADGSPAYPALLGTGGNDGRLDFTNNFMQRLTELFDVTSDAAAARDGADSLLRASLFEEAELGLGTTAVGQFFPGACGGANSSTGFGGGTLINPWDFVLMLEGSILFASSVTRRAVSGGLPQAAAPFAVRSAPAGYGSAAEEKSRGEQWMPIWKNFTRLNEVRNLLSEARCQAGRAVAERPLDTARAIARLGVARGVTAFERYGYVERNGLANLAVPLGRWQVSPQPNQQLLDEIVPWYERLERAAADKNAPGSIGRAARRCQDAMMNCCRDGNAPGRWLDLLLRLGEADSQLTLSPSFTAAKRLQPLPPLSPDWVVAAQAVQGAEFRLALAIAGQHASRHLEKKGDQSESWVTEYSRPVRMHWLPLAQNSKGTVGFPHRFATAGERLLQDADVVCHGLDLGQDLTQLVRRRLVQAAREEASGFISLRPASGAAATLDDIGSWLDGDVDERLVLALLRTLLALNWKEFSRAAARQDSPIPKWLGGKDWNERRLAEQLSIYGLLRLCYHWQPIRLTPPNAESPSDELLEVPVKLDAQPFQQLMAGSVDRAANSAIRRLQISGLHPHLTHATGNQLLARRLATSLAIPISDTSTRLLAETLTHPTIERDSDDPAPEGAELDYQTA